MKDRLPSGEAPASGAEALNTLPEIAQVTGIPLDDLKYYRREYAARIPIARGDGPRRYPPAALEMFRTIHDEQGGGAERGNGGNGGGVAADGRRLLSLSAQRRQEAVASPPSEPAAATRSEPTAAPAAVEPTPAPAPEPDDVHDPGPPSVFDELSSALSLISPEAPKRPTAAANGADREARREANLGRRGGKRPATAEAQRRPSRPERHPERRPERRPDVPGGDRGPERAPRGDDRRSSAPAEERKPNLPPRPPRRPTPPPQRPRFADTATEGDTEAAAAARFLLDRGGAPQSTEPRSTEPTPPPTTPHTAKAVEEGGQPAAWEQGEASGAPETAETAETAAAKPLPSPEAGSDSRPSRPSRPIYTLQEIHELTAIPYAKLSLFAARHSEQIPSVGERYSPAYTRQGLEALCRLYAAENPGWEMPHLGPERGWDDDAGLAARLEAMERTQQSLGDELESAVQVFLRPWSGEAQWEQE